MKQHITIEQLGELSDGGKDKLIDYLFPNPSAFNNYSLDSQLLLSIGQMIEFLGENFYDWSILLGKNTAIVMEANRDSIVSQEEELCDALWESVKEVLER